LKKMLRDLILMGASKRNARVVCSCECVGIGIGKLKNELLTTLHQIDHLLLISWGQVGSRSNDPGGKDYRAELYH